MLLIYNKCISFQLKFKYWKNSTFIREIFKLTFFTGLIFITNYGCSNDSDLTGGTGTEVTNGIVILSSAGDPVVNAEVKIIDGGLWCESVTTNTSPVVEILFTDSIGKVYPDITFGTQTIQVNCNSGRAIVEQPGDTVTLTTAIKTIKGYAPGKEKIIIGGTDISGTVLVNDSFTIDNLPLGIYSFFNVQNSELSLVSRTDLNIDSIINIDPKSDSILLFEDFGGGYDKNPLTPVSSGVLWYTISDSQNHVYKNGIWEVSNIVNSGNSSIIPSDSLGVMRQDIYLGDKGNNPYVGVGVALFGKDFQTGYDLSELTAIHIKIRGTGTIKLFLESSFNDSSGISHYNKEIILSSTWQEMRIPIEDLHLLPKDASLETSHPWISGASEIKRMEFIIRSDENSTNSSYWIEIDEIRFENVKLPL